MFDNREAVQGSTRRGFLSRLLGAGAIAGWGTKTLAVAQISGRSTSNQELRTDVVVVGTGIAGLTAAVQAQRSGARVIVLEKASSPGGTTHHSNGHVLHYTFEGMRKRVPDGDPEVQRTVAENLPHWDALMDTLDAPIGRMADVPGNPDASRRMIASAVWVKFMVNVVEKGGGKVLMETPMLRVLANQQNEVIGVLADGPQGVIRIYAKAVVLATGGWMTNAQLVQAHITRNFESMRQLNVAGSGKPPYLGDGLFAALQLGAQPSTGGFDAFYGYLVPARPGRLIEPMVNYHITRPQWMVAVNRFGRRFTDEAQGKLSGRQMSHQGGECCGQEVARQPDAMAAYILDGAIYKEYACDHCEDEDTGDYVRFKEAGSPVAKANTFEELARQMEQWNVGIRAETVVHELAEYNLAAKNRKAWALPVPKTSAKHAIPLQTPPYYALLGQAGITATQGGLRVNKLGQVLHRSGKPIPGLYAAGVDIGNFSNYRYLGNLNLGAAYGYVSGTNAAKQPIPLGGWEDAFPIAGSGASL